MKHRNGDDFYCDLNDIRGDLLHLQTDWQHYTQDLEDLLKKALPYLRDGYDGYYGEQPVTKLAQEIRKTLGMGDE